MERIVHFDLKGAPLKIAYFEKVLQSIKKWGATGVLLEWEDTFPYSGDLVAIGSQGSSCKEQMYSKEEVGYIIEFAKAQGLLVIQLVQTIGHLEFVLKHPAFRDLREQPRSPAVLCPSKASSQQLVREMVMQVLDAQPDAEYLHIGADEVWHAGICETCKDRANASKYQVASLFLEHIRDLTLFIKQQRPKLTVLIWDDMLRNLNVDCLNAYNIGTLVEPVVWNYNVEEHFRHPPKLWDAYGAVFTRCWAGSAYKGANGSSKIVSPVQRYVSNHVAWVKEVQAYKHRVNFGGIFLTGWSRYDHFATLCEMMPVSIPSLAICLKIFFNMNTVAVQSDIWPTEDWPGVELTMRVHKLVTLKEQCTEFFRDDAVLTWLNPWQVKTEYTNPLHVEAIAGKAQSLQSELIRLEPDLKAHLHAITGPKSVAEFLNTWLTPILSQITTICNDAERSLKFDASVSPKMSLI